MLTFPPNIALNSLGGPEVNAHIIQTKNGQEHITAQHPPRITYDVATGITSKQDLDELIAFFRIHEGPKTIFRFKDWNDYQATEQTIEYTLSPQQLYKTYTVGTKSIKRKITKPIASTFTLTAQGTTLTDYTLDETTGTLTLTKLPATIPKATYQFHIPARFNTPTLQATLSENQLPTVKNVSIIEIIE